MPARTSAVDRQQRMRWLDEDIRDTRNLKDKIAWGLPTTAILAIANGCLFTFFMLASDGKPFAAISAVIEAALLLIVGGLATLRLVLDDYLEAKRELWRAYNDRPDW